MKRELKEELKQKNGYEKIKKIYINKKKLWEEPSKMTK